MVAAISDTSIPAQTGRPRRRTIPSVAETPDRVLANDSRRKRLLVALRVAQRLEAVAAHAELEQIGTGVVSRYVEGELLLARAPELEVGHEQLLAAEHRLHHVAPVRGDDRRAPRQKLLRRTAEVVRQLEVVRQVGLAQVERRGEDESASLEGIVAAGELVRLLAMGPRGDVDLFACRVQHLSRERHPVLPADEPADALPAQRERLEARS